MSEMAETRTWLRQDEAAKVCGVTPQTLWRWRKSGVGPSYYLLAGETRYTREELEAWIASKKRPQGGG
jgi:predicted DNA-binding transcriptional regulator AlpA